MHRIGGDMSRSSFAATCSLRVWNEWFLSHFHFIHASSIWQARRKENNNSEVAPLLCFLASSIHRFRTAKCAPSPLHLTSSCLSLSSPYATWLNLINKPKDTTNTVQSYGRNTTGSHSRTEAVVVLAVASLQRILKVHFSLPASRWKRLNFKISSRRNAVIRQVTCHYSIRVACMMPVSDW